MALPPYGNIETFGISIAGTDGREHNLTPFVTEIVLNENIYYPFSYGELGFVDGDGFMSEIPLIGQERIGIHCQLTNSTTPLERLYIAEGIKRVEPTGTGQSGLIIGLLGANQYADSVSYFSRYYAGPSHQIIGNIFEEFFNQDVNFASLGDTVHRIVIPYTTPLRAIRSMLNNTWAHDKTPLFLYETLFNNEIILKSYGDMMKERPTVDITPTVGGNPDISRGISSKDIHPFRDHVNSYGIPEGYNVFNLMASGAIKHRIQHADYGQKRFDELMYNYRRDGRILNEDYISNNLVSGIQNDQTIVARRYTNSKAYERENRNLYNTNQIDRSAAQQYAGRHKTVRISVTGSYNPNVEIGKTVEFNVRQNKAAGNYNEGPRGLIDHVNSGKYIVASIEHRMILTNNPTYHVNYQLIRDGLNTEKIAAPTTGPDNPTVPLRDQVPDFNFSNPVRTLDPVAAAPEF